MNHLFTTAKSPFYLFNRLFSNYKMTSLVSKDNEAGNHVDSLTGEIISKSELKRRLKARTKEAQISKKLDDMQISAKHIEESANDDEEYLDPNQYFELRSKAVNQWKRSPTTNPFPHYFSVSLTIPDFISKYEHVEAGTHLSEIVSISGRIFSKRVGGSKLIFYDILGDSSKVQIMAQQQYVLFSFM